MGNKLSNTVRSCKMGLEQLFLTKHYYIYWFIMHTFSCDKQVNVISLHCSTEYNLLISAITSKIPEAYDYGIMIRRDAIQQV